MAGIMSGANDLSLEELEARAAALEQELSALRSVIALRMAQAALAAAAQPPVQEAPVASSLRLSGYLSDGTLWDIAIPFEAIGREGGVTIGRDETMSDIPLPESGVSRRHIRLMLDENGLAVADQASTNGTFINSAPLPPDGTTGALTDGDTLTLGSLNLRVDLLF